AAGKLASELAASLDQRLLDLEELLTDNAKALERARLAAGQARTAERAGPSHPTVEIVVHLGAATSGSGAGSGVGALDVSYAVPAARWWPVYTARIRTNGAAGGLRAAWSLEAL